MKQQAVLVCTAALLATLTACGSGSAAPDGGAAGSPLAAGASSAADPAGASGGSAPGGATVGADPCTVLTPAVVGARTRRPMSAGKPDKTEHTVSCTFHATKGLPLLVVSAGYYVDEYDRKGMVDLVTQQEEALSGTKGSAKNVPVAGIGEAALYVPGLGEATALKSGRVYYVIAWTGKDSDSKTVATALVKHLIQHLA